MKAIPPRKIAQVKKDDAGWMQRNKKQEARRDARREVLPGFPWEGRFETREDVDDYLSEGKILCLLCGKRYIKLGCHLRSIHDTNYEQYHERYGIPFKVGLATKDFRDSMSEMVKSRLGSPDVMSKLLSAATKGRESLALKEDKKIRTPLKTIHCGQFKKGHIPTNGNIGGTRRVVYIDTKCSMCGVHLVRDAQFNGDVKCDTCKGRTSRANTMSDPDKAERYRERMRKHQAELRKKRREKTD